MYIFVFKYYAFFFFFFCVVYMFSTKKVDYDFYKYISIFSPNILQKIITLLGGITK